MVREGFCFLELGVYDICLHRKRGLDEVDMSRADCGVVGIFPIYAFDFMFQVSGRNRLCHDLWMLH